MTVHVLIITHKYGTNVSVFVTCKEAMAELYEFVEEWWGDCGDMHDLPEKPPKNHKKAIDAYFQHQLDHGSDPEGYEIEQTTLKGAQKTL